MANCNVTVRVPAASFGSFEYSVDGGAYKVGCINLAEVDEGDTLTFVLTLEPWRSGDTAVFNTTTPLEFVNWKGQSIGNPVWYSPQLSSDDTVLTFTDDSLNVNKRTYYFKLNVQSNGSDFTSTDPTIINAGTGGDDPAWVEEKVEVIVTETLV